MAPSPTKPRPRGRPRKAQQEPEPEPEPSSPPSESEAPGPRAPPKRRRKAATLTKEDKAYRQQQIDALDDDSLFERHRHAIEFYRTKLVPLEEDTLGDAIGPDIVYSDELERQWSESTERQALEKSHFRLMGPWKVCLRIFRCSPMAIITPLRRLVHHPTLSNAPDAPVSPLWGQQFCVKLSILLAHRIWKGKPAFLAMLLQFAVICRTDDRRVWEIPSTVTCPVLKRLRAAMRKEGSGPLSVSVRKMLKVAEDAATRDGLSGSGYSTLMSALGKLMEEDGGGPPGPTKSQGLEVYAVTLHDLVKIEEAFSADTDGGHMPPALAYNLFLRSRVTNDVPRGKEQFLKFYRREWLEQQDAIAEAVANMQTSTTESGQGDLDLGSGQGSASVQEEGVPGSRDRTSVTEAISGTRQAPDPTSSPKPPFVPENEGRCSPLPNEVGEQGDAGLRSPSHMEDEQGDSGLRSPSHMEDEQGDSGLRSPSYMEDEQGDSGLRSPSHMEDEQSDSDRHSHSLKEGSRGLDDPACGFLDFEDESISPVQDEIDDYINDVEGCTKYKRYDFTSTGMDASKRRAMFWSTE
ncbi:hypothetical protein G7Z17_g12687 [Cylindrodendrum hubeiense]|uniref:Uncharacterized protein n=1 Tax=Cylindrodendrum hubeiense TaxID=595255 RepID=A0A9P5H1G2_9HYPO|nr:hypothetical protein G7Z17_g12687 [Cylindrodendrum hubeiense]